MTKEQLDKGKAKEAPVKESLFYIHQLQKHSRDIFGVKPEVLDGVFAKSKEIQVTKSEAKKRIDAFLRKGVKQ
ncbi:hypothetical protein H7992_21690 [Sporosarcina sp. resist]|uniref:hypothetical protein n=1 Tax=Sporosarcina sp. resist TaxID=2762563 RepID=UPI00164ECB05|nr:hypothetical protein [Sporosarcina sp. resist]QNK87748.1 hypothetical protein H7992_21690 [Sporosarcina sp. resist]